MTGTEKTIDSKSMAYNLGAVDFIEKPFHLEELCLRINVWIKDARLLQKDTEKQHQINDELLILQEQALIYKDISIGLLERELIVLSTLLDNINQVVSKETLLLAVWKNQSERNSKMLNNYISNLKKELKPLREILEIKTIYGRGIKLKTKN
jgi:Response regulators consisting of a CheY-like receiver domain and a winged-helix DNA-binding domain